MSNTSILGSFGGQAGESLMFRNRIINGDMRIDQRYNGAALSYTAGESKYNLDRWTTGIFGTTYPGGTLLNIQQSTDAPAGFTNSLRVTAAQNIAFDSNKLGSMITHNIEGNNVADFAFGTASAAMITLSFWVKSNKTGTVSVSIENNGGDRAYGATVSIAQAATWERKTITVTGDILGTWLSNNSKGICIIFGLGNNGSWLTGAAGSWSATRAVFNSAQTNFLSATNDYFAITGVQLEAGPTATPFERRPIGQELMLCQRYYERISIIGNGGQPFSSFGTFTSTTASRHIWIFSVPKRVTPTSFTASSNWRVWDGLNPAPSTTTAPAEAEVTPFSLMFDVTNLTGGTTPTQFRPCFLIPSTTFAEHFLAAAAEL